MAFITDKEQLKSGLIIFRRGDVAHRNFYCRVKLPKENRYKTIALRTADPAAARDQAFDADADIRFRIKHDVPVFNRPFRQVAEEFIATLERRVKLGEISADSERIHKLEDAGAIASYTISVDAKAFGLSVEAHVRLRALPGEVKRLAQLLIDTPEVVEADRVTGEDCFVARVLVRDIQELETVVDRFLPLASTDTAIVQSSPVARRLPRL